MNRRSPVDGGILAARLYGSAIRLVHSGATGLDELCELVELAAGRAHLLTEQAPVAELRRRPAVGQRTRRGYDCRRSARRRRGDHPPRE